MKTLPTYQFPHPIPNCSNISRFSQGIAFASRSESAKRRPHRKLHLPKNLQNRRRTGIPPDFHPVLYRVDQSDEEENDVSEIDNGSEVWESDEIEAISSLFQGRVPQKPGELGRERPLPLPLPHKIRPLGFPATKNLPRTHHARSWRRPLSDQVYKNPSFLIKLAKDIRALHPQEDVSIVLNQWARFLRKGSLSIAIRELGHMGVPERALHVFCWVQKQPHLFPDDRILAATVEVLARSNELKMPFDMEKFISLASQSVYEAMVKGYIKGGNLGLARKLLSAAMEGKKVLDPGVYAKLILELGKNPDKRFLALPLLEELARRDDLKLKQQDCTAVMKVCIHLGRFDIVEALYSWLKASGTVPTVVTYTTMINSRCLEGNYREAMAVVWEMEMSNCAIDFPAYRVLIKLFVALQDVGRVSRYFVKLKEDGFVPTYDIYSEVIGIYVATGRIGKGKEIWREAEMAGFRLDERMSMEIISEC
ncbi:pentatricopeptide repeat-containing protein At2g01860 [Andrographis paniculata]|uniref:pentatricopeptide repeat-containing protein At2g01860 n=1 Tax=Andrographis paniculata TaxID=175694 RepID=UPI0021E8BF57|nr:pentatricopeptide repeat-containing protein At2g01860 [Andrographis paniculata]